MSYTKSAAVLIMLDGPDGSGKTTQVKLAAEELTRQGKRVLATRINGGSPMGEALRSVYLADFERPVETDYYLARAIYAAFCAEVDKNRNFYDVILVDRSPLSLIAYQAFGDGLSPETASKACRETLDVLRPEGIIVYTGSPEGLLSRRKERDASHDSYFEKKSLIYHGRLKEGYEYACSQFKALQINGEQSVDSVHTQTMQTITSLLNKTK